VIYSNIISGNWSAFQRDELFKTSSKYDSTLLQFRHSIASATKHLINGNWENDKSANESIDTTGERRSSWRIFRDYQFTSISFQKLT
jgi:hypothetical protein